jgi:hypothetical protein
MTPSSRLNKKREEIKGKREEREKLFLQKVERS